MSTKSDRRVAREALAAYHEAQLAEPLEHVGAAIDSFRAGQLAAFEVDQILFHTRVLRRSYGSSATWAM